MPTQAACMVQVRKTGSEFTDATGKCIASRVRVWDHLQATPTVLEHTLNMLIKLWQVL